MLMVNVDGAWNETTKQGGVGVIIRNDRGNLVAAAAAKVDFVSSLLVEAAAARMVLLVVTGDAKGFSKFRS